MLGKYSISASHRFQRKINDKTRKNPQRLFVKITSSILLIIYQTQQRRPLMTFFLLGNVYRSSWLLCHHALHSDVTIPDLCKLYVMIDSLATSISKKLKSA